MDRVEMLEVATAARIMPVEQEVREHSAMRRQKRWLLKEQKKRQQKDAVERNKRIADENEKRDANSAGTMLLLRVQLIEYHDRYMKIGYIPSYAYENFCQMYEAYHRLGGNGMVEKMHDEIQELHLKRKGD